MRLTTRKHEILSLSFVSAWKQEAQGLNFLLTSFSFFLSFFFFFRLNSSVSLVSGICIALRELYVSLSYTVENVEVFRRVACS